MVVVRQRDRNRRILLEAAGAHRPKGELAPRLVKYVLNNRKHGTYWNSTRDTAFCIEALADYLKASGEDRPEMTVAIALDGQTRKEVKITPADLFTFDNTFVDRRCRHSRRARTRSRSSSRAKARSITTPI